MKENSQIAILLFSRSARVEAESKCWLSSQDDGTNESLALALISKTKQTLAMTGLPVISMDEKSQRGESFGERLANAFESVFSMGYSAVIAVGCDCPDLSSVDFSEVAIDLSAGKPVLGPDFRDGVYLIGLTKDQFHKHVFAHLSWQTSDLYDDLVNYLHGESVILGKLRDFNDSRDLFKLKRQSPWLRRLLRQLITFDFPNHFRNPGWDDDSDASWGRRGPP